MTSSQRILSRWVAPACLAIASVEAVAQEPMDLPPLPDAPLVLTPAPVSTSAPVATSTPVVMTPPPVGSAVSPCTPGHCSHRSILSRRRCKRHLQEVFMGFPEEFERPPLGAMMHNVNIAQVRKGEAASLTLHQYDFMTGTARLNTRGLDRLARIAAMMPVSFAPVVVERSIDRALDEQRREAVIDALADSAFPVPDQRVVIGPSPSRGLRGDEAILIHEGLLYQTQMAGPPVATGTTSSSPAGQP